MTLALLVAQATSSGPAPAASGPAPALPPFPAGKVALRAFLTPARARLAEVFHLVVEVRHPSGQSVVAPKGPPSGKLEAAGPMQHQLEADAKEPGMVVERFRFPLQAFALGSLETPAMQFTMSGGAVVDEDALKLDPLPVQVVGALEGEKDVEPAPLAPAIPVMREDPRFLAWPPLLLFYALVWVLVRYLDKQRPVVVEPEVRVVRPLIPPHKVALQKIEALRQSDWLGRGETARFVDEAIQIAREYLELSYDVPVLEQTTYEAMQALGPAVVRASSRPERRRLAHLNMDLVQRSLSFADAVKFARARPDPADCARLLDAVVQLVETTRPIGPDQSEVPL